MSDNTATAITTAIGFGSLLVARTEMLQRFGIVAALGVMVTYLILITFIPAAITYFEPPAKLTKARGPREGWLEAVLVAVTAKIARGPVMVVVATGLVILPCLWAYASIRVDTALLDTFDENDPIVVSTRLVERHLDGIGAAGVGAGLVGVLTDQGRPVVRGHREQIARGEIVARRGTRARPAHVRRCRPRDHGR